MYYHPRRLLLDSSAPPSNHGGRQHGRFSDNSDFDTNMVIILAALLCALICALGLNSIFRCALRFSQRFALQSPGNTAVRLATTGLQKNVLRKIPVTIYGSDTDVPVTDCPICLAEFVEGEKVRVLPRCHHGFHVRCIDIWLASHSSCPTCRRSLLDPPVCSDGGADTEASLRR